MVQSSSMPWWKAIQGFWDNWDSDDPNDASSWTWDGRDVNQISMLKKVFAKFKATNGAYLSLLQMV